MSAFESEPYFLLSVLKKLPKLDSSYLRQKLLMTLDELLEEKEHLEVQGRFHYCHSLIIESSEKESVSESSRLNQDLMASASVTHNLACCRSFFPH